MITEWRLPCLSNHGIAWLDRNEGPPSRTSSYTSSGG